MTRSVTNPLQLANEEINIGERIRSLRNRQGLSLRQLSEASGLNINTLSLIENGKSSPSVSTLQSMAFALGMPISAFFESEVHSKAVVFTTLSDRPTVQSAQTLMQNLGKDFTGNAVQPFELTIEADANSGEVPIVHTGFEFVYCLEGLLNYTVEDNSYPMQPGDSLVFESHLPHSWKNAYPGKTKILLILFPKDQSEKIGGNHIVYEE